MTLDKSKALAAIERGNEHEYAVFIICDKCNDGLIRTRFDSKTREDIDVDCDNCRGTGYSSRDKSQLIPELAEHLRQALARIDELESQLKGTVRLVLSPEDDSDFYIPED